MTDTDDEEEEGGPWEWALKIKKVENGYVLEDSEGVTTVIERKGKKEMYCSECQPECGAFTGRDLLYFVADYFALLGDRYARHRISVKIVHGDKWEKPKGE